MKNNTYSRTGFYLAGSLLAGSLMAQGVADQAPVYFEESVLTAEQEPGNFAVDSQTIELLQANDLSDLLSYESTVAVGGGSAVAQKIYVRGFEDTLLNVTIDGAQQAGELYHHQGRVQIEPEFVKTIELDAGAGAATSGAGALTGALRVTTKNAFDMLEPGQDVGAFIKGTAGLNGDDSYKGVFSAYARVTENIGVLAAVTRESGNDYDDGHGDRVEPTGYDHERGYFKVNGEFGDHEMSLSYENLHDYGTYYERPHMTNFTGSYILSDHEMNRETLTYNHNFDAGDDLLDIEATLYWTSSDYNNHRNTTGDLYGEGELTSYGYDVRNTMRFADHQLTYGSDLRLDDGYGAQQARGSGSSDQSASVFGLYAQDNWNLSEAWLLSAGLRYDNYRHEVDSGIGDGVKNDSDGFSPNVSVEWEALTGLTLRTAYSMAYRGVTIRESFFSGLYAHGEDMDAEEADNFELGVAYENDGYFARATYYIQHIDNYIDLVSNGSGGYDWGNAGDARVEGYEIEIGKEWEDVRLSFGVWEADNSLNGDRLTDGNLGLGTSIGRTWTAKLDYALPQYRLNTGVRARLVESEPNDIAADAPDKDGYFVTDVHANWVPFEGTPLTLSLSINNLFDEYYYDQATYGYSSRTGSNIGFASKGREFVVSAAYKF
ncbi:TonB-dependent receptor [Coraliomargarita sp. SDUM461004]|uniref:TonB-dependent receptor n=1 Tax=Thalassobacterium sedimentorum TaxID=3041258 RepID=A0ABU1ADP5_9BACT|nr:TonB-dependent receptor [Coraliomargarita sp. SDUM461004]MDQ8192834.1 TonB-dependent receptor [Coraliomargarita sp. SDUM461004]